MLDTIITIIILIWGTVATMWQATNAIIKWKYRFLIGKTIKVESRAAFQFEIREIMLSVDARRIVLRPCLGTPFEIRNADLDYLVKKGVAYWNGRKIILLKTSEWEDTNDC